MYNDKQLKYLWIYSAADEWTVQWHNKLIAKRRAAGYKIIGYCITPPELQRRWLPFKELNLRWKSGDPILLKMYKEIATLSKTCDVLILYNGANLHPDFTEKLDLIKVYTAGDDPESTEKLSKPLSIPFDIHLVNNISCVDMYKSWGFKNVYFWPLGSLATPEEVLDVTININSKERDIPVIFIGGVTCWRKNRFRELISAFPNAYIYGDGWESGRISYEKMWHYYRLSQIGWNLHNSIGPVNFRTYELPAYGIMQICDNKAMLDKIFKLNEEVIGFDTIEECIDKTRYYLKQTDEQREIALKGHQKWLENYHPDKIWEKLVYFVLEYSRTNSSKLELTNDKNKKITLFFKKNKKLTMSQQYYKIITFLTKVTSFVKNRITTLLKKHE